MSQVGASPVKFSVLHGELAVIALTSFLTRPVPTKPLKRLVGLALRYTVMPAVVFGLATKMLVEWPTVWVLRGVRDKLTRGHWMPLTAVVPFTMMVSLHWAVVAVPVSAYYGAGYAGYKYVLPALLKKAQIGR